MNPVNHRFSVHGSSGVGNRGAVMKRAVSFQNKRKAKLTADFHRDVTIRSQMVRYGQSIPTTSAVALYSSANEAGMDASIASFILARHLHFYVCRISEA